MQPAVYYDPTAETTNDEQVASAHWECLRRNAAFRKVARSWLSSETYRKKHALTDDYHHPSIHHSRCALDWMLSPAQRISLFHHQVANLTVFNDLVFNFGPIVLRRNFPQANLSRDNAKDFMQVTPLPEAPPPITVDDTWGNLSEEFKKQFRHAVNAPVQFQVYSKEAKEWSYFVRRLAKQLATGQPIEDIKSVVRGLMLLGGKLYEFGELYKLVAIPNQTYSKRGMKRVLDQVEGVFSTIGHVVSDKKYNRHKSYFGTREDWRWFLEAEARRLDPSKPSDLYQLAQVYSEHLRQTEPGKRRKNVKTGGFRGGKVASRLLNNRRATIRNHIRRIQNWIDGSYPPKPPTR